MTYKALYRTYRPISFEDVVGQKHIILTLQNAVRKNKIAHAYLFCGPRGTGKTSVAKILAKAVNCEISDSAPCNQCNSCISLQKGNHTDIIEIDAASNNGVDEIRSLIEKVKYASIECKYKVYIIDEVHMLSTGAFNALLKTLEEPPSHVIFILATTEPHKVIPTIISRCQRYDFNKVETKHIGDHLEKILKEEKIQADKEAVSLIATLADGGLRDALSILEQCIAYAENNITLGHISEIYGITTMPEKIAFINNVINQNIKEVVEEITSWQDKGIDIKRLTADLIDLLKEAVIYDYTKDSGLLVKLDHEQLGKLEATLSNEVKLEMIKILMETMDSYRNTSNVYAYFEVGSLKMIALSDVRHTPKEVNVTLKQKETNVKSEESKQEETINPVYVENTEEPLMMDSGKKEEDIILEGISVETILQLMVQANKQEKVKDIECWQIVESKCRDLDCAKYANLLKGGNVAVSGELFILIATDYQALENEIREQTEELEQFMCSELFINKRLFVTTKEKIVLATQEFINRRKTNQLPEPLLIEAKKPNVEEIEKEPVAKTDTEVMESLFGNDFEIVEED